ncbi:MAG: hypothetical protein ACRDHK_14150 [Actinomycetota bacterium]
MELMDPSTVDQKGTAREEPRSEDQHGLRFEDPYWDDAFCAWWDPTLRTCC